MVPCPRCQTLLPLANPADREGTLCPGCQERFYFQFFPALLAAHAATPGHEKITGTESNCFYHAGKIAVRSCDYCGRLLCGLCAITVADQQICPTCLARGKEAKASDSELRSHTMPDAVALSLAILPTLLWPVTVISAPLTFVHIFKNYRKFHGIVPRNRWRYWLAGVVATGQIALWLLFFGLFRHA